MESKTKYLANLLQNCIDKKSHKVAKLVHAHILRIGLFADTFLSNRLIELYYKCGQINAARNMFDKIPHKNIFSWHAMLSAYCKASMLDDVTMLFDEMPERNSVSWNTVISALVRSGFEKKALGVFYDMNREGFMPTHFTLASVLSACGALLDVESGRECHGIATKIGLDRNMYVGNALLGMYSKCKCIQEAIQVFDELLEPNEVSFTAIMGGLAESDRVEEAFNMFRAMYRNGINVDSVSLSSLLGVCTKCGTRFYGQQTHGLTIKLGFENNLHLNNSLLDMYGKNGDMESAEKVFDSLQELSTVSWNVMISGFGQNCQTDRALEYMHKMQSFGFDPDEVTNINLLSACVRSGDIKIARQVFDKMVHPSVSSCNAILSAYFQSSDHKEAVRLFREMRYRNIPFDQTTMAIILGACAGLGRLEGGKQVHAASLKSRFHIDIYIASGLIGLYTKCGKVETAISVFHRTPDSDIVCWNSIIAGLSLNSRDQEAFYFFKQMLENGLSPTEFSYATVITSCAKLSSLSQGKQVQVLIIKQGFINDVFVGSALIGMYSKRGDINCARQVFDKLPYKNTVIWNEMIHGYAQSGNGYEAVSIFKDMIQSCVKPDDITFVTVLTACSHSGLVDHAIAIFDSMEQEHGCEPTSNHYTCILDSLSRAGRFDEVENILNKMKYKDDPLVWEVVLSSCRVHANVALAKRATDELLRLDPQNSSPYVLLANLYSSLGRWDDVEIIREMMIEKNVTKSPGYSWVEHGQC